MQFSSKPVLAKPGESVTVFSLTDPDYRGSFTQTNWANPILVSFREVLPVYDDSLPDVIRWWIEAIISDRRGTYEDPGAGHIFHVIEEAQGENPEGYGNAAAWSLDIARSKQANAWRDHAQLVLTRLANLAKVPA